MREVIELATSQTLNLGDRVRIKYYGGKYGKIVELRGALGPDGAQVYRVRVGRKPFTSQIELLGDQIEPAPRVAKPDVNEGNEG